MDAAHLHSDSNCLSYGNADPDRFSNANLDSNRIGDSNLDCFRPGDRNPNAVAGAEAAFSHFHALHFSRR
jgi:hypothetical protein